MAFLENPLFAILAIFQFFQNGTFEPVHEIWKAIARIEIFFVVLGSYESLKRQEH